jgi:hypothetical protein
LAADHDVAIYRFPRLSESASQARRPESTENELEAERAALEACASRLIARRIADCGK